MEHPHDAGWSCEGGRIRGFLGVAKLLTLDLAWISIWTSLWHLGPLNRRLCPQLSDYYGARETSDPLLVVVTV